MDSAIVGDLKAAVVELHDRLQYRTNVLGDATTSLARGYSAVVENLGRAQQSLDADTRALHDAENQRCKRLSFWNLSAGGVDFVLLAPAFKVCAGRQATVTPHCL